ncbi:MAG: hypothetical protein MR419_04615 [Clostridiales bacterium]|nr:hypothetical protein [Clostridiales bacterium]MDY4172572.1 hypothetical protein [Evtepia sp.]
MKIETRFAGLSILKMAADWDSLRAGLRPVARFHGACGRSCARPAGTLAAERNFFTGKAGEKMI